MASYKNARAAEDIKRELSDILRGLKDPRITGLLSIVKLELSSDYSYCKVFISSIDGLETATTAVEGLKHASGLIRREISSRVRLRKVPMFQFIPDDGIAHSDRIDRMLRDL